MGKIEPEVSGIKSLFWGAPKSLTAINTCLDEMEELKGRDTAIQKKLTKKGLQKGECLNINYFYRLFIYTMYIFYTMSQAAALSRSE